MTLHFKQCAQNQAQVNGTTRGKLCGVCCSGTHNSEQCEANPNFVNYVGNVQSGQGQKNYGNSYNPSWRNNPNFSWGGNQNQNQAQGGNHIVPKGLGNNTEFPTKV